MYGNRLSALFGRRPNGYISRRMPLSQMLGSMGRGGDTMVAHINPQEAMLLKRLGGRGTINPNTGLREFLGFGGFGGMADKASAAKSAAEGRGEAGSKTTKTSIGEDRATTTAGYGGTYDSSGKISGTTGPGEGGVGSPATAGRSSGGGGGGSYGAPTTGIGSEAAAIGTFEKAEQGLDTQGAFGAIGGLVGGPLGGLIGSGIDAGIGAATETSLTEARDRAYGGGGFSGGVGIGDAGSRGGDRGGIDYAVAGGVPPISDPTPPVASPPPFDMPIELGDYIEPGMTDEQIRALIATYGTQGNSGYFGSPDVFDYYASLLRPAVDTGGYGAVLPIEHQYLNQTFGLSYDPTVEALMMALGEAGLPADYAPPPAADSGGPVKLERRRVY